MANKPDAVIAALKTQLAAYFASVTWTGSNSAVTITRNTALPEVVPDGGLIIIRDGDPGEEVDPVLGQLPPHYYDHTAEIEVYVEHGVAATRDTLFAAIVTGIGVALDADPTLGGVISGLDVGPGEPLTTPIEGGADLKSCVIKPVLGYFSSTRL